MLESEASIMVHLYTFFVGCHRSTIWRNMHNGISHFERDLMLQEEEIHVACLLILLQLQYLWEAWMIHAQKLFVMCMSLGEIHCVYQDLSC